MKKLILTIFIFAGLIIAANGLFVVYEGEQAFVTRFGKPIGERLTAGLHCKTPFIEDVTRFESRILKWDGDPGDQHRVGRRQRQMGRRDRGKEESDEDGGAGFHEVCRWLRYLVRQNARDNLPRESGARSWQIHQ